MRVALLFAILLPFVGCESAITGNEGNFRFAYAADDDLLDFNKPIAVGAMLDLRVTDVGSKLPVALTSAGFDSTSVMTVDGFSGHTVTVVGVADGQAQLQVEGETVDGETLTDSVDLQARTPEVLRIRHTCDHSLTEAAYLTGQRIWLAFEMEMENGQPVIGRGYFPMSFEGEAAPTPHPDDSTQQHLALDLGSTPGDVTLSSTIDDTTAGMKIVTPAQIDGVMDPIAWVLEDIDVGDTNAFYVLPSVGGVPICQAEVTKTVVSDTPETCTIQEKQADSTSGDASFEFGWFEVTGVAAGECRYTVSYPDSGTSAQFSYPIEP